ncbi:sigma-54 interaction domain-containing protein [Desulfosporosinus orientis]|nr:sigma 54-interacting transcriptional regulator [Desulfosporosinus orientis]
MKIGELTKRNFATCLGSQTIGALLEEIYYKPLSYVLVMTGKTVSRVFHIPDLYWGMPLGEKNTLDNISGSKEFIELSAKEDIGVLLNMEHDLAVVFDDDHQPLGVIDNVPMINKLLQFKRSRNKQIGLDYYEFDNIIDSLDVDVFITDGEGYILFLNPAAEKVCGIMKEEVIGKHVTDLEKENLISKSITMEVIKNRKKINILQKMNTGKTVLSSAIPIFNEAGEVSRVLSTSNNVADMNELLKRIEKQNQELVVKEQQLDLMREAVFGRNNYACFSKGMEEIKETVIKIAPTDLTVLIQGESGVGKEVVAKLVHSLSSRTKHPLVKINCGLIPENLIESELFGYESGAFTGANKAGKIGKIEMADQGTLFLDEIGEMPLLLQVKLLEFLQDREITRVGGTKRINIDTRIIAATNRDLKEMVQQGKFREDLYYRLNVFPLRIAPLRERAEDILTFAEYFLGKFNDKYILNKKMAPDALDLLAKYNWPGNVREFEHVMERAVVISNTDLIAAAEINVLIDIKQESGGKIFSTGLMPWKVAKKELEKQLIKRAYDIYKSTYKAAEALDVCQSTVAKMLKNMAE